MTEERKEALDFRQNVTIALLAVLAVVLLSRTELFSLGLETLGGGFLSVPAPSASAQQETVGVRLSLPIRFAATSVYGGVYGRYAMANINSQSRSFRSARVLFGDALAAPLDFEEITREEFLSALRRTSLYCDFMAPLPLSLLGGLLGAELSDERPARALALTRASGGVWLCLWDGAGTYCRRAAPVPAREFDDLVSRYELSGGAFALDFADADAAWRNVAPLSLFPDGELSFPVYSAVSGLPDPDRLLSALRFNPLTKTRYTEANGTEVIMEDGRSVRIRANGAIAYQDGGRGDLRIESAGEIPTGWEAASECAALLNGILLPQGCAAVYPLEIRRQDSVTTLRFGCALENLPVFRSDGGAAAVVTLEQRKIVSLELRPRRYAITETNLTLLPAQQALGLTAAFPGAELCLGYYDTGGARLNAQWFARDVPDAPADGP